VYSKESSVPANIVMISISQSFFRIHNVSPFDLRLLDFSERNLARVRRLFFNAVHDIESKIIRVVQRISSGMRWRRAEKLPIESWAFSKIKYTPCAPTSPAISTTLRDKEWRGYDSSIA
jgi:hypothetical protein